MRLLLLSIGLFLCSNLAFAAEAIVLDVTKSDFDSQKTLILKTINEDKNYSEMSQSDRTEVVSALDSISATLSEGKTFAGITPQEKQSIDANQANINKLLARAFRDSKMICTREMVIGSNMPKRICKTAAARNRDNANVRANEMKVNN
jgi:hypothetical protein